MSDPWGSTSGLHGRWEWGERRAQEGSSGGCGWPQTRWDRTLLRYRLTKQTRAMGGGGRARAAMLQAGYGLQTAALELAWGI